MPVIAWTHNKQDALLVARSVMCLLRRTLAVLLLATGLAVSALVFLVGAPAMAGAPFREPVGTVCYDPWLETHPGDYEPDVSGTWSWWPPGITCRHASGEVFLEPSASKAAAVGVFGFAVLILGGAPTLVMTRLLWAAREAT